MGSRLLVVDDPVAVVDSRELPLPAGALGVAAGLTALAMVRRGGFFYPDSIIISFGLVFLVLAFRRITGAERPVVFTAALFCAWWLLLAFPWEAPHRVVLLPATVLGFVATWLLGGALRPAQRVAAQRWLLGGGCAVAALGLVGVAWRMYPLAMPHDGLWRATGTFSYANGLGLALAMLLPLALMGRSLSPLLQRAVVVVITTGLLATVSRGAFVAAAGALLVSRCWRSPALGAFAAALAIGAVLALGSNAPIASRADPGSVDVRWHEWTSATSQFADHPIAGSGPERLLILDRNQYTYFAHNEYLQIAAGGGVVALGLFGWFALSVTRFTRSRRVAAWGIAALVAVAIGGMFDFTWHLPAIGVLAGWVWSLGATDP